MDRDPSERSSGVLQVGRDPSRWRTNQNRVRRGRLFGWLGTGSTNGSADKKQTNKQTNKNQTKPNIKRVANPSKTGHVTQSFLMTSEAGDGAIFLELEPLFFLSIFLSLSARVERLRTKPTIKPTSWPSGGALPTGRHFVSRAALLLFLFSRPLFPNFCDIFSLSLSLCVCVCVRVWRVVFFRCGFEGDLECSYQNREEWPPPAVPIHIDHGVERATDGGH